MTDQLHDHGVRAAGPDAGPHGDCCTDDGCCSTDQSGGLSRRGFIGVGAGALVAASLPAGAVAVPADKKLDAKWVDGLFARGRATQWSGAALANIGMPVGGACSGQVYVAGDGRLWLWDVLNDDASYYGGTDWGGVHYADPIDVVSPFRTGFAIRTRSGRGAAKTATLDSEGFSDVTFTGQYPVGQVAFRDDDLPVEVDLSTYSPFIPTNLAESELPVTIMEYTVRNTGRSRREVELLGFSENPVCLRSRTAQPVELVARDASTRDSAGIEFSAQSLVVDEPAGDDVVFEDWKSDGFGAWTATGTAFGAGPVDEADAPPEMKRFGALGSSTGRFVTSYNFRAGGQTGADDHTGLLTSPEFTITHSGIMTRVGGGTGSGVHVDVVVDGKVVATATGLRYEPLRPVFLDVSDHVGKKATVQIVDDAKGFWAHISCDRFVFTNRTAPKADRPLEDWADHSYAGWTVSGNAFGASPVKESETPDYFRREGPLMPLGEYFVTSHAFRDASDAGAADARIGKLTGGSFTIDRRYLVANIGGGADSAQLGLRVVVDGEVVARLSGNNSEVMTLKTADLGAYQGRSAHLEIVDDATGGWGHVNCDRIWLSDLPLRIQPVDDLRDAGTFSLAVLDGEARVRPSVKAWRTTAEQFDSGPAATTQGDNTQAGAVSVRFTLRPGERRTVRFALAWHFPRVSIAKFSLIDGAESLRHHYAKRFDTAADVVAHVARHRRDLTGATHAFVDTWYADSTIPHWLVERTLAPASTVATETCQRFDTGRFYAWEGTYCCVGTCTHVWNYAQSLAYLFPELERDARSRVDFGLSFHEDTGAIDYRGEGGRQVAHDGQCGNILRTYREHQMSASDGFLRPIWPKVKKATEYLIDHDGSTPNGILEADQYNTLDATWFGEIPWISGLYVAALQAAAEMAVDMGDATFARRCRTLAAAGSDYLDDKLWNEKYQYFEHTIDPDHRDSINSNRGCYIDQMFGQTYAHQLGLSRVFTADKSKRALDSIYRNNYMPDARAYMDESGIEGGRLFSADGEPGTLMCTWPFGGADEAPGTGEQFAVGYFNEVWTGTEWQLAAHLVREGHVEEGLTVARAIYDRYSADKRNPYNEVECSDHYARSMMSHAVYLAVLGFEHHGPRGHLGFAPRLTPDDFRAGFTVSEGWGTFSQRRGRGRQEVGIEMRYGRVKGLRTLALEVPGERVRHVDVTREEGRRQRHVKVESTRQEGTRLVLRFEDEVDLDTGETLSVTLR